MLDESTTPLFPGYDGQYCPGNGTNCDEDGYIICWCDECDYLMCCTSEEISDCRTCTETACEYYKGR